MAIVIVLKDLFFVNYIFQTNELKTNQKVKDEWYLGNM